MRNFVLPRSLIFHPLIILLSSLIGAALYVCYATRGFSVSKPAGQFFYVVPIIIPFVAFLFDRAERFRELNLKQFAVDAVVVVTAMWRVIGNVPYVSGHTLFLTYALLSSRSLVVRITGAIVMIQVIYLKYIVWHDWVTSTCGIVLGVLAAFVSWKFRTDGES